MTVKIKQAVVLCGGLGTRLRPFTDQNPKPMVRLNNKPFLDYLFDQMLDNGIRRVLLLTGYLSDKITDHYGTQYKSLKISYSHGDVSLDTAERLEHAADKIDDYFLLMYSDNYSLFSLKRAISAFHIGQSLRLYLSEKVNGNLTLFSAFMETHFWRRALMNTGSCHHWKRLAGLMRRVNRSRM